MEKLKDCSHTVIPSDCLFVCCQLGLLCLAVLQPVPMASPGPATAKELIHQAGDSKTPSLSVQFSAIFSSPRIHHPFYRGWHKVCCGNEQLGVVKWHMTTVSGSSLGLCCVRVVA